MGQPAARLSDNHVCPMVTGMVPHVGGPICPVCAPTVLIGGLPAARIGDQLVCIGPLDVIASGSNNVLIGGRPAARMGDMTVHGGVIVVGDFTVLIGGGNAKAKGSGDDPPTAADPTALSQEDAPTAADPAAPSQEVGLSAAPAGSLDDQPPEQLSAGPAGALDNADPVAGDALQGQVTDTGPANGETGPDISPGGGDAPASPGTQFGNADDHAPLQGQVTDAGPASGGTGPDISVGGGDVPAFPVTPFGNPVDNALQGRVSNNVPGPSQTPFGGGPANAPRQGPIVGNGPPASPPPPKKTKLLEGYVAKPGPVLLLLPNGKFIEVSEPRDQSEHDAQVWAGTLQGSADALAAEGGKLVEDLEKKNVSGRKPTNVAEPDKPEEKSPLPLPDNSGQVLEIAKSTSEKFNLEDTKFFKGVVASLKIDGAIAKEVFQDIFKRADLVLQITDVVKGVAEAQEPMQRWAGFLNKYDAGVADGSYPNSPIVRSYVNAQMLQIVAHAYGSPFIPNLLKALHMLPKE